MAAVTSKCSPVNFRYDRGYFKSGPVNSQYYHGHSKSGPVNSNYDRGSIKMLPGQLILCVAQKTVHELL